jgi:transposase
MLDYRLHLRQRQTVMSTPPDGISKVGWLTWPTETRAFILAQRKEVEQFHSQLTDQASYLAIIRDYIVRSSRNSSKPPCSDGCDFKPTALLRGSGRKRGGKSGHHGSGPELLPNEQVNDVVEHHPDKCRRCGNLLKGEDPDPLRHRVIEMTPIKPMVIEHLRHAAGGSGGPVTTAQGSVP